MESLLSVSRGKPGGTGTGKRDYRPHAQTGWHTPLPRKKCFNDCIDARPQEERGSTVRDERVGQAFTEHFSYDDGQPISDDHPERTAQPHAEKTPVLTG